METHELATRIAAALESFDEVLEAYVFGSVGRGEARPDSDVDVAVTLAPERVQPADHPYGIRATLTAALMSALGRNDVDLVVMNEASPLLAHEILRDGVRVFARDLQAATVRESQMLSRWCDWKPVQDRIDALLKEKV